MMEDLEITWSYIPTIPTILLGLLLAALVIAFIFSHKFRQDVIAGQGAANVLGVLTVEGVVFVLLCGLFIGAMFLFESLGSNDEKDSVDEFIRNLPREVRTETPGDTHEAIRNILEQADDLTEELAELNVENEKLQEELSVFLEKTAIALKSYIEVYYSLDVSFVDSNAAPNRRFINGFKANLDWSEISHKYINDFRRDYENLPFSVKPYFESHPPGTKIVAKDHDTSVSKNLVSGWVVNDNGINELDEYVYLIRLRSSRYTATDAEEDDNHASYQIVKLKLIGP